MRVDGTTLESRRRWKLKSDAVYECRACRGLYASIVTRKEGTVIAVRLGGKMSAGCPVQSESISRIMEACCV